MQIGEQEVIENVIIRLRGDGNAADYIKDMLQDDRLRRYLNCWVIPGLQLLIKSNRHRFDIEDARRLTGCPADLDAANHARDTLA